MARAKSAEPRKPMAIRIRPTLLRATRKAADKAGQYHVDWVENAFVAALERKQA